MRGESGDLLRMLCRGAFGGLILAICFSALPVFAAQDQQDQSAPPPAEAQEQMPDVQQNAPAPAIQLPSTLTLPPGTIVTVRTSQFLSSDRSRAGDVFSAELQQPVVVDGWVVARRGQTVLGRVAVAQKAGRVKGTSQLGVELSRLILVDGQQLAIRSQLLETSGGTSKGRDAEAVGTTTGIGAIIGGAAHGGEGAGVGAAIGAGAGLAGVLLTRGRPTVIPPETVLTFELQSPASFSTQRSRPAFRPVTQADYNPNPALRRRTQHFAGPPYPPPYYYAGYAPWWWGGYYYPAPFYFGFYGFGGRGFRHGGFRR
jgi:hypothetical protein